MSVSGPACIATVLIFVAIVMIQSSYHEYRCVTNTEQYIEYIRPYTSIGAKAEEKFFLKKELVECLTINNMLYSQLNRLQDKYNVSIIPVGTMDSGFLIEPRK